MIEDVHRKMVIQNNQQGTLDIKIAQVQLVLKWHASPIKAVHFFDHLPSQVASSNKCWSYLVYAGCI